MTCSGASGLQGLSLEITPHAAKALADEGYDPQFGARPLRRVFQQRVENQIAARTLAGEFVDGDTIRVDHQGKRFALIRMPRPEAPAEAVEAEVMEE